MKFSTKAIHIGQEPDSATGSVIVPIYQTTTYYQEEIGKHKGYAYSRSGNPTRAAFEKNIAALENGKYGLAFSSGVAAIHSVLKLLKAGDCIVVSKDLYGGTYRLIDAVMKDYGIESIFCDFTDTKNLEKAITKNTKIIHFESPTNPTLKVLDIKKIVKIAHQKNILVSCDNTFMSPFLQNPLDYGVDIVIHSSTKYLGGHSDVVGGCVITNNEKVYERLKFIQNSIGAVPSPFDCWLLLRAIKTLALRMERHCENAILIAKFLTSQRKVKNVFYPGLKNNSDHKLAKIQQKDFGGMISFELSSFNEVQKFLKKLKIFTLAESLGGVESLVSHPATMTHKSMPKEEREKAQITDGLVRLSIGIEDVDDLINDLKQALK